MAEIKTATPTPKPPAELRRTPIGRLAEQPARNTSFPPGIILLGEEQKRKRLAYVVAGASLALCAFLLCWMAVGQGREREIMVLDSAGTVHSGPLVRVNGKSEIFRDLALWGTQVALQRSTVGFNMVEYIPMFFRPNAVNSLNADLKSQLPDLQARNLRQYPEIKSYQFLDEGKLSDSKGTKVRFLSVTGNIIRVGFYQGMPVAESVPFRLVLAASPNPNLLEQDKYPYQIEEFRLDLNPRQ